MPYNYINGTSGADSLTGLAGWQNWIEGFGGNDTLIGVDFQLAGIFEQGDGGDGLHGGDGHDSLYGMGGNDALYGDAGDDYLNGGSGDDLLRGGSGVDYFDGQSGRDRISFHHRDATQAVWVSLATGVVYNDGYGNTEYFWNIEDLGQGTIFADSFEGNGGANYFLIDAGDYAFGDGGDDRFELAGAAWYVDGGSGIDTLLRFDSQTWVADFTGDGLADMLTTTNGVSVDLLNYRILNDGFGAAGWIANVENVGGSSFDDWLRGDAGANILTGYEGKDKLIGDAGDDVLIGGDGNDRLWGEAGADISDGGAGADIFLYEHASESIVAAAGRDTIAYFESGIDLVDLRGLNDEVAGGGWLSFASGGFTGVAGEVTLTALSSDLLALDVDLNGDLLSDFSIRFEKCPAIVSTDLLI